jgi:hypothetical protein
MLLEWNQIRLKEKVKAGLKVINKFKENAVQIKELMAKPAYLSEESIKECNRNVEAKIEVANMINANIATIQSKSSYLNEDQVILLANILIEII